VIEEEVEKKDYARPFLPNHILEEIGVILLVTGIVLIAASLRRSDELFLPHVFFAGVLEIADAISPLFATLVILATAGLLIALPFLDRSEDQHPRKRGIFILIVLGLIGFWVAFTILGF
jgi:quinol-cytochrome oxidoreductase complex cytochrome b subunit